LEKLNLNAVGAPQPMAALDFTSSHLSTQMQRDNAQKIVRAFAQAGYGAVAQIAAVANAIGESGLDHMAANTNGEDSHGLFQLNRKRGVGTGHTVEDLQNADKNIAIMLNHIIEPYNKAARHTFMTTKKLAEAVQVFVFEFEKPADKAGATATRIGIAKSIAI
ncbi:MAG: phage tail tip lysozyme, partial [Pseudomonadota bacterium]